MKEYIFSDIGRRVDDCLPLQFFLDAQGAIVMYDVTDVRSFDSLRKWMQNVIIVSASNVKKRPYV